MKVQIDTPMNQTLNRIRMLGRRRSFLPIIAATMIAPLLAPLFVGGQLAGGQTESAPKTSVVRPRVILQTSLGEIQVELFPDKSPITVKNFLRYARAGRYDKTLFHRVISPKVVEGGRFTSKGKPVPAYEPIRNEAENGLRNNRGTLAMARGKGIHDATSGFLINTIDNHEFNHFDQSARYFGYSVFGKVVKGMPVVDRIKRSKVAPGVLSEAVPTTPILLEKVTIVSNSQG